MSSPSGSTITSALLWLAAVGLMIAESRDAVVPDGILSRWSILVALAATCWTISALINHARRVMLDVISIEHQATRAGAVERIKRGPHVVPIRRGSGF
jgi:hypothetical protein